MADSTAIDPSNHIVSLLENSELDLEGWCAALELLESDVGIEIYREILVLLTQLDFPAEVAKIHWHNVVEAWRELGLATHVAIDVRVAVLHYFLSVNRKLENPTVVEMRILLEAQDSAIIDELTQLYNFRYFKDRIENEVLRAERESSSLTLLMLDLDDFKLYNDRVGHLRGNVALQTCAQVFRKGAREVDVVSRYGGEEFAILLPGTTKDGALAIAERIRHELERTRIPGRNDQEEHLTVSIGVASVPTDAADADQLLDRADAALYRAKAFGKNRVNLFSDERREFARFQTSLEGEIRLLDKKSLPIETANISRTGLLFMSKEPVAVDSTLQVELAIPNESEPLTCIAKVVRVTAMQGRFEIGVKIIDLNSAQARRLRALVRQLPEFGRGVQAPAHIEN
jgi:diguanylate cyclase (GGDEF)-like protein